MATDLEQLQRAILQNQQATQSMAGLDERYDRANALRDAAGPQPNQYGFVSPLSVIADTINKSRGRRDIREVEPLRNVARKTLADTDAQLEGNTLRMAMDKEAREVAAHGSDIESQSLKRTLSKKKSEADLAEEGGKSINLVSTDGKIKKMGFFDENGKLYSREDGKRNYDLDNFIEDPDSKRGGYRAGQYLNNSTIKALTESSSQIAKFDDVVERFDGKFAQQGGMPTNIANKSVAWMTRNDLLEIVANEKLTKESRAAAQWWADFQMIYSLPRRHEIFGATLTARELSSWDEAVGVMAGMSPDQMRTRLEKLQQDLRRDYKTKINTHMLAKSESEGAQKALRYMGEAAGGRIDDQGLLTWEEATAVVEKAAAPTGAEPTTGRPEATPEQKMHFGKSVTSLAPEELEDFQSRSQEEQLELLWLMWEADQ